VNQALNGLKIAILAACNARTPFRCQARFLNAEGEYRWLDSSGMPRFSASDEVFGYVGASLDITETKRVELNAQFLNQLSLGLSRLTSVDEIIQLATGKVGRISRRDSLPRWRNKPGGGSDCYPRGMEGGASRRVERGGRSNH
jgi:hypothetical protein